MTPLPAQVSGTQHLGSPVALVMRRIGSYMYHKSSVRAQCILDFPRWPASDKAIGIDVGLESFAVLSDGTEIDNPRYYRQAQAKLRCAQKKVAPRRKCGSCRTQSDPAIAAGSRAPAEAAIELSPPTLSLPGCALWSHRSGKPERPGVRGRDTRLRAGCRMVRLHR